MMLQWKKLGWSDKHPLAHDFLAFLFLALFRNKNDGSNQYLVNSVVVPDSLSYVVRKRCLGGPDSLNSRDFLSP